VEYGAGPGLLCASMQTVFAHMGSIGNFIGFIFYLLVLIAALTSSISMLELCTAYAVDKQIDKGLTPKRAKHTASVAALVFVAGSLVALDGLGLEVPRRRLLQALLQVHRAGAARVHPLLPAHRLLRPEDPRPELNPASQKVPSASAPTGGR